MFTAHMHNEKTAEELLAQTRTPQDAYEYAIRREKGLNMVDHIRGDHKTQEDNKEKTIQTVQNNVIKAETNTIRITCNHTWRKIKFVQNVPNEVILQKFADLKTLII